MELKTLKDFEASDDRNSFLEELKAEAVKIRIYMREMGEKMKGQPEAYAVWLKWLWEYFFNLTEEDLKDG